MKSLLKLKVLAVVAVATLAFAAPVLAAGSWHPIQGTPPEDGSLFISSNVRTVSKGGSAIKVQFAQVSSKGTVFGVLNYNTGQQIGHWIYAPPLTTQQISGGTVSGGTLFVNAFRLEVAGHQDQYTFTGSEYY